MKKTALFFVMWFALTGIRAQFMPCLYDLAVEETETMYPGYREHLLRNIEQYAREGLNKTVDEVYTIPLVVHVVWKEPIENIPQERIDAQIRVLNEVYRRQNADTINTRSIFHPVVGDPMIEFVLSQVIRVQTTELFQPTFSFSGTTLPDKVKRSAQGGSDAIDTQHHLNIWICAIQPLSILGTQSPILGYAYPPAGLPNWPAGANAPSPELDGVVVDYRTIGDNLIYNAGSLTIPIRGRTLAHEVGHYLGLRHISGDGLLGLLGLSDCNSDDGISDTPNQGRQSQFDCNAQQNTCNDGAGDLPDMIENYMDYSMETCQNAFTQGQIAVMRAVLEGPRAGLPLVPNRVRNVLATASAGAVFPNPSPGVFHLRLPEDFGAYSYWINDAYGRLVFSPRAGQARLDLDLATLPQGIYFLQVKPENRPAWLVKLVRQ